MNKEIGGYIEFEHYHGKEFHNNAIGLNCSRNALAYLIKLHNIKKLYIPYYLCDSVFKVCQKYDVEIDFYHISEDFLPIFPDADFTNDWLYIVNYYGQLDNTKIEEVSKKVKHLIIDNVQAFFQEPVQSIPTIYNCRKFFGVTDGAYLYSDEIFTEKFERDFSYNRMEYLVGRFEKNANEFYQDYVSNNKRFAEEPIKIMSFLTENIMRSLDYNYIRTIRTDNFTYLHEQLKNVNKLNLCIPEGAFAYPLLIENGAEIRKKLQSDKIYIPTLWPNVIDICNEKDLEYKYTNDILPLPVDQRYGKKEMLTIFERIKACIN